MGFKCVFCVRGVSVYKCVQMRTNAYKCVQLYLQMHNVHLEKYIVTVNKFCLISLFNSKNHFVFWLSYVMKTTMRQKWNLNLGAFYHFGDRLDSRQFTAAIVFIIVSTV